MLDLARAYGHTVTPAQDVDNCWTITAPGGAIHESGLVVYATAHDGAVVYATSSPDTQWVKITQVHARSVITSRSLGPQALWDTVRDASH